MTADSLGEYLRLEREKRGITLEQVASATKINVKVLHLLEADQYSDLPAKPFVRGFVVSYARFIGLDVQDVITRFSVFLEEKVKERPQRDAGHTGYAFEKKEGEQSRTWLWTVLTSFAILGGIAMVFIKPKLSRHRHTPLEQLKAAHSSKSGKPGPAPTSTAEAALPIPSPAATSTAVQPSPAATAKAPPAPKATPTPQPTATPKPTATPAPTAKPTPAAVVTAPGDPTPFPAPNEKDPLNKGNELKPEEVRHKLVLKAIDDIYVRYTIDGKPVTSFILRKDSLLMVKAKDSIVVQVSDPERVYVKYRTADFVPLKDVKDLTTRNQMTTIVRPNQLLEKIGDPFPGARQMHNPPPKP